MNAPAVPQPEFELGVRKTQTAATSLPSTPLSFQRIWGDYATVSRRAVQLNDVQKGLNAPDYVFFADTVGPESNPVHCDMCKRLAIREAARDD